MKAAGTLLQSFFKISDRWSPCPVRLTRLSFFALPLLLQMSNYCVCVWVCGLAKTCDRERGREWERKREREHALLCAHWLELSNHLATAAQKKSAADWHSAGLTGSAHAVVTEPLDHAGPRSGTYMFGISVDARIKRVWRSFQLLTIKTSLHRTLGASLGNLF